MANSESSGWRAWTQRDKLRPRTEQLSATSRLVYRIDHYSSLSVSTIGVGTVLIAALVVGAFLRFSSGWLAAFEAGSAIVTLVMVFVIQHTQGREQAATQRKLDELLRALPEAESDLMMLEQASEEVLHEVELDQRATKAMDQEPELGGPPDEDLSVHRH